MGFFDFLFGKNKPNKESDVLSAPTEQNNAVNPIEEIVILCIKDMKERGKFSTLNLEPEAINLATYIYLRGGESLHFNLDFLPKEIIEKTRSNDYNESDKVFNFFVKHSCGLYNIQHADAGKKGYKLNINLDKTIAQTLQHHFHKIHNVELPKPNNEKTANTNENIDLGLPSGTLWAVRNIGALEDYDSGTYFAWGETSDKDVYGWESFKHAEGSFNTMTKYCNNASYGRVDNKYILDDEDDAAHVILGEKWHIPSSKEFNELIDFCNWKWKCRNEKYGWEVTGPNGNRIFLPAAGAYSSYRLANVNESGRYWCSDMDTTHTAFGLRFNNMTYEIVDDTKFYGRPIRPVFSLKKKSFTPQGADETSQNIQKQDEKLNDICWLAIKQLAQAMSQNPIYRSVETTCRKLPNGTVQIHQCYFDGRLYNDWIFEGKDGWLNTAAIYGEDLGNHERIIGNSRELFGMKVAKIVPKQDCVVFYLDRSQFGIY